MKVRLNCIPNIDDYNEIGIPAYGHLELNQEYQVREANTVFFNDSTGRVLGYLIDDVWYPALWFDIIEESSQALRYNEGKPQWSLVDLKAFEPMVRVLEFGAIKYAPDNWRKGGDKLTKNKIIDSLMRHLVALRDGEEYDDDSTLLHIGHIQCNAMFLSRLHYIDKNIPIKKL